MSDIGFAGAVAFVAGWAMLLIGGAGLFFVGVPADRWAPALAGVVLAGWAAFEWWRRS